MNFNNKNIIITGGTGSFGKECVKYILKKFKPNKLVVFQEMSLNNLRWKKSLLMKN